MTTGNLRHRCSECLVNRTVRFQRSSLDLLAVVADQEPTVQHKQNNKVIRVLTLQFLSNSDFTQTFPRTSQRFDNDGHKPWRPQTMATIMMTTKHDDQLGEIYPTMLNELNCTYGVSFSRFHCRGHHGRGLWPLWLWPSWFVAVMV